MLKLLLRDLLESERILFHSAALFGQYFNTRTAFGVHVHAYEISSRVPPHTCLHFHFFFFFFPMLSSLYMHYSSTLMPSAVTSSQVFSICPALLSTIHNIFVINTRHLHSHRKLDISTHRLLKIILLVTTVSITAKKYFKNYWQHCIDESFQQVNFTFGSLWLSHILQCQKPLI